MAVTNNEDQEVRQLIEAVARQGHGVMRALEKLAEAPMDRVNVDVVLGLVLRHLKGAVFALERLVEKRRSGTITSRSGA